MIEGISRKYHQNPINTVGYGYIVLPYNVSRRDFIDTAYRKEKVSIIPDQGSSYINDCYITRSALREISWPKDENGLGSAIVYVTNYFNNKPFILGVISKEDQTTLSEEYGITYSIRYNENKTTIAQNAERGEILLNVNHFTEAASIILNSIGQAGTKIALLTNGKIEAKADENIEIRSIDQINITSTNNTETNTSQIIVDSNNINIRPNNKLNINEGSQPVVLGDELSTQLNITNNYLATLVSAVETALTIIDATAGSVSAPGFKSTMSAVNPGDYDNINSEIAFTD
jgi:hypothetical protein